MRFASVVLDGKATYGAIEQPGEGAAAGILRVVPSAVAVAVPDLRAAIATGRLLALGREILASGVPVPVSRLEFLPLIPNPSKILCVGVNYVAHRSETGRSESTFPVIFTRFADTQVGHLQALHRPPESTAFDYEGELAIVIGAGGRRIPVAEAPAHIAGFACYNDATVRDWQRHTHQFTPGKNFPATGAFGPFLVTADEVPDPKRLVLRTRLNDRLVQEAPVADLIFGLPELIAYISTFTPLLPGDVIVTGTPGGVGDRRTPPLYLRAGDLIEVEIDGVGVLSNPVRDEPVLG